MGIHKHHARNAKRIMLFAVIVWIILGVEFFLEYRKDTLFRSGREHIKLLGVVVTASILSIYSFIERRRAKRIEQIIQEKEDTVLLEQKRFVMRKETGIFTTITYFGLNGSAIGILKEIYHTHRQKVWKCILSFFSKGTYEKQFYLYNQIGKEVLRIKKKRGIRNSYSFYHVDGEKIGELNQLLKLTKWEWIFLLSNGNEIGKVTGDLSATLQKGIWRDGTYIDVKEGGIPLEAIQYFSASGGSLITISVAEQTEIPKAVYYAVAALIMLKE
ncbi:sugar ABC transporter ATP-binding protein [Bacillus cytotoxicus]|uniref:sugar ABC transporter ATP-binding protein n=1 Tax=Bacillus cereus group sp. BfR-BA-01492 TaxID=2920361 RepID=UPI001F58F7F9|nr:sugar ABC transporter ATP-binding protein [Bacillus cereus group sp. BfR-BA-01492]